MRVVFTCGGTGGHINPAIAVAKILRERRPDAQILFVGANDGMEKKLVPREGHSLSKTTQLVGQACQTVRKIWKGPFTGAKA